MKARNLFSKVLSFALVAVMLLGMLPMSAFAAEAVPSVVDSSKVTNGMYMNKYTTLEDDGTYTITLEAFATGTTTTSTLEKAVPLDIVLVLDQSGSMSSSISGASSRMAALINAVDTFIESVYDDAVENEVDHRIAVVGFASTGSRYTNTEILSTSSVVNYGSATNNDYANAMVSVNNNGALNTRLTTAVDRLDTDGDTYSEYGFDMANKIFAQNSIEGTERQRVVVMFTDGYTAPSGTNDFHYSMANAAIANANISKTTYGASVYSVAVLNGANPNADIDTNFQENDYESVENWWGGTSEEYVLSAAEQLVAMNRYMHYTSSNFPKAQSLQNGGTRDADKNCYLVASDSASLLAVFQSIFEDVVESGTTVTLDETSVTRDIVEPSAFNIPDGYNKDSSIKTYTEVVTATESEGVTTYTRSGEKVAYEDATVVVDDVANTIEVSNFDYAENFVAPSREGKMLIIEIRGIEVTDIGFAEAEDDGLVDSNAAGSGIYSEDGVLLFPFVKPNVELGNKSYVVDYAKQFEMLVSDWGMSVAPYISENSGVVADSKTELILNYGYVNQVDNTKYTYTPNNMNWDGFDTFYAFGKDNNSDLNKWAKVNVIPANNVYYEDSFVTEEGEDGTSTVGIEYGEGWSVETSTGNGETANTPVHGGWENSDLADDDEFSDGTAHVAQNGAKVNFTFTGTGVDVYSYTDIHSGAVRARLYAVNAEGAEKLSKVLFIDNVAESGAYYNVPTLSFGDLDYGTYKLELYVYELDALGDAEGKRSTYYLDGIRIYNPLGTGAEDPVADETVKDAYENELNAVFTEVRDILIDATNAGEGATELDGFVFIDNQEIEGEADGVATNVIATYEDYGPKNEVYLAKGQKIGFKVNGNTADNCYYIGLKAPAGASSVKITNGAGTSTIDITHSTDLYYELIPSADNYVVIENTGDALISITKLRTTSATAALEDAVAAANVDELLAYVDSFSTLPEVAYGYAPEAPETDVEEPVEPSEPEVDVEIENPEEPEDENAAIKEQIQQVRDMIKKMFDAFRGWLGR